MPSVERDAVRELLGVDRRFHVGAHDDELVAAGAGREVRGAQHALEPLGERDEQVVAGRVAERVVDELEPVEVEEQDRDVRVRPGRAPQRPVERLEQERPVGETGERVVRGVVGQPVLELLAVGDVEHHAVEPERLAVVVVGGLTLLDDPADAAVASAGSGTR